MIVQAEMVYRFIHSWIQYLKMSIFKDDGFYNILGIDSKNILNFLENCFESYSRFCACPNGILYVFWHTQAHLLYFKILHDILDSVSSM